MTRVFKQVRASVLIASTILVLALVSAGPASAQGNGSPGNNAVYDNQGNCCMGSSAFVDARRWTPQGTDLCDTIHGIISSQSYPANGTVIDARGLNLSNTTMVCAASPWVSAANKPSTILLLAGTITIPATWILPGGTMLVGVGTSTVSNANGLVQTTIQACKHTTIPACAADFATATPMLQFGSTSGVKGISVEQLTLNGNGLAIKGIENANSQEETYVDHVSLFQILGTGLYIHGNAQNSGPYTNITYDTNGAVAASATCVNLNGVNGGTRGIQGLTCKANYSTVAVLLDSSNNSLKDVRIVGFDDGIRVGSVATAQSNLLMNILGDTDFQGSGGVINVIHIWGGTSTVTDLTIVGAANQGNGAYTIKDDRTALTAPLADPHVAIYAVGRSPATGMYSRFTTSPHAANWSFGAGPASSPPTCQTGSLYSETTGGALYVCDRTAAWHAVTLH